MPVILASLWLIHLYKSIHCCVYISLKSASCILPVNPSWLVVCCKQTACKYHQLSQMYYRLLTVLVLSPDVAGPFYLVSGSVQRTEPGLGTWSARHALWTTVQQDLAANSDHDSWGFPSGSAQDLKLIFTLMHPLQQPADCSMHAPSGACGWNFISAVSERNGFEFLFWCTYYIQSI